MHSIEIQLDCNEIADVMAALEAVTTGAARSS